MLTDWILIDEDMQGSAPITIPSVWEELRVDIKLPWTVESKPSSKSLPYIPVSFIISKTDMDKFNPEDEHSDVHIGRYCYNSQADWASWSVEVYKHDDDDCAHLLTCVRNDDDKLEDTYTSYYYRYTILE